MQETRRRRLYVSHLMLWMFVALFLMGGVAKAHWTGQLHSHYTAPSIPTVPSYQAPTFQVPTFQAPAANSFDSMLKSLDLQPQQPPQVDWRDFTRDFAPSPSMQMQWERQDRATQRNAITIPACHTYNRGCLNELLGLD